MLTLDQMLRNRANSTTPSEQILGPAMDDFATFWENNQEAFTVAKDAMLVDFCNTQNFDNDGLRLFRFGMDTMYRIFEQASADRRAKAALNPPSGNSVAPNADATIV